MVNITRKVSNTVLVFSLILSCNNISYAKDFSFFSNNKPTIKLNSKPSGLFIKNTKFYDADTDDLVTAGYGFSKLSQFAIQPEFVDATSPTLQELRKAKFNRYIDTKNGEGVFFGFNRSRLTPLFDGKIAGYETQASYLSDDGDSVAFLLQIPLDFDQKKPCIVAVPTSGSEGVYNAKDMQIRGLWGLNHNCAVVYNDKGLGNFLYDIGNNKSYQLDGRVVNGVHVDDALFFSPEINNREQYIKAYPNRYAVKQLHSQKNSEAKWGEYTVKSIEFAFYQLNEILAPTNEIIIDKNNTIVLVYGASDGGGAALKAGEYDKDGFIDGIVAVNPQIQIADNNTTLFIQHGDKPKEPLNSKPLIDYTTYGSLYLPCAVLALKDAHTYIPFLDKFVFAGNRCHALKKSHLLESETTQEQAAEALNKLYQYGWSPEMAMQLPYSYIKQSGNHAYQYISAYGKYRVDENLCDYSVASIDQEVLFNQGEVKPLTKFHFSTLWANHNGNLPIVVDGINTIDLVNNVDPRGARQIFYSSSKNNDVIDYNLSGAICLRETVADRRVQMGLAQSFSTGKLNQIKTIIVHGQLNTENLIDYSSRAYVALNSYEEASLSQLRYIEVENASELDGTAPFDHLLVPIDYYGENAMDWLWSNLTKKATLPDSQVVKTKPRGGKSGFAPTIDKINLPTISQNPRRENIIFIQDGTLMLPY